MTRPLVAPPRTAVAANEREAYDRAFEYWANLFLPSGGRPEDLVAVNPWAASLMHSPRFSLHRAELSSLLRTGPDAEGTYTHQDREWVGMTLGPHLGSLFLTNVHIPAAVALGIRPAAIEALLAGDDSPLTAAELERVELIREVVDGAVTDRSFDAAEERLGARGVVEYVYYITCIWTAIRQIQAFGCPEPSREDALATLRAATAEPAAQDAG